MSETKRIKDVDISQLAQTLTDIHPELPELIKKEHGKDPLAAKLLVAKILMGEDLGTGTTVRLRDSTEEELEDIASCLMRGWLRGRMGSWEDPGTAHITYH